MAEEIKPFILEQECRTCGFSDLHHKSVDYGNHIETMYKCALCKSHFSVAHHKLTRPCCG